MNRISQNAEETIAAIATAPGEGGISIVRVSGPDSLRIADQMFRGAEKPSQCKTQHILHGRIVSPGGDVDEVLLLIMRAPRSYTCEDVVEIQGHGGNVTARRVLRQAIEAGARPAEPGEFTKRAFLNGRIDLLQAEAVLDLIQSRSDRASAVALEQLEGALSERFDRLYNSLIGTTADLEASLDFPEDELPASAMDEISKKLAEARTLIDALIDTWDEGHLLRDGARIVITGKTNVGKSTLINALLERPRAIVSQRPGTTRDFIEESLILGGIPVRLIDTAGLRDAECEIEQEGIERTRGLIDTADLQLHIVDASADLDEDDLLHLSALDPQRSVVVLNKIDLGLVVLPDRIAPLTAVKTSLLNGEGVDEIRRALRAKLDGEVDLSTPPHAVISERHRKVLVEARRDLQEGINLLAGGSEESVVPAAQHLRGALEALGTATGRVFHDELLSRIFSRFCIGK